MATTRAVVLAALIVCCGLAIVPAAMALDGGFADVGTDSSDDSNDTEPMGAEVSSFMQSTAADSSASVDERMFVGAYENADDAEREAVVVERTEHLEQRLAALEAEREDLREREAELNPAAYEARMSRLAVQISALERAIDDAEPRAEAVGVDTERFETLRNRTAEASGPEVARAAGGLAGVDPPAGPPEDRVGGPSDEDDRGAPSNADRSNSSDDADRGSSPDEADRSGQSDDRGNSSADRGSSSDEDDSDTPSAETDDGDTGQ